MILDLLKDAHLSPEVCASLLGISPHIFDAWVRGTRDLPGYIIPELASVLGVSPEALAVGQVHEAPAIWFKFRKNEKLSEEDRELILLIRRLGFYAHQLDCATSAPTNRWQLLFKIITEQIQPHRQASPGVQGREAAKVLRDQLGLGFPRKTGRVAGCGDLVRPLLRNYGVLVIEAPLPKSQIEGCSFYVGGPGEQRPCLFVNTYEQDWFRRNHVLMHELAHAIFDIESDAASIDFRDEIGDIDVKEIRAEAFAAEVFASKEMLRHLQSMFGLRWDALSPNDLASLVAYSQIELKLILRSAREHGLLNADLAAGYENTPIFEELKGLSDRALSTEEYQKVAGANPLPVSIRMTTIPSRSLRLPVSFIARVISAVRDGAVSESKAAEMLMIDEETFAKRFATALEPVAA